MRCAIRPDVRTAPLGTPVPRSECCAANETTPAREGASDQGQPTGQPARSHPNAAIPPSEPGRTAAPASSCRTLRRRQRAQHAIQRLGMRGGRSPQARRWLRAPAASKSAIPSTASDMQGLRDLIPIHHRSTPRNARRSQCGQHSRCFHRSWCVSPRRPHLPSPMSADPVAARTRRLGPTPRC